MQNTNRLAKELSPYLQQHAHNPVDWYPWGQEAFDKARQENKLLFVSIGYATCHWCHVMAHESFEDPAVAAAMNDIFVCVKVDREERPDVDKIYMAACHLMTSRGGWPLNVILTPEAKPVFAFTYLPKETGMGQLGMSELPIRVKALWLEKQQEFTAEIETTTDRVRQLCIEDNSPEQEPLSPYDLLDAAFAQLTDSFDPQYGGFGPAPKFPSPQNLLFLLGYHRLTSDKKALDMALATLVNMRRGGLFDQLGFGFHRYSTDAQWLLPHFEKMLYDQALLCITYTQAFELTRHPFYERTAREILSYVSTQLTAPEGCFCTAEDADSEGEEGKFYVFQWKELEELLGPDALFAAYHYGAERDGNFLDEATQQPTGGNILHVLHTLQQTADYLGISLEEAEERDKQVRQRLLHERGKRQRPLLDDKVLTDWNGLMIAAFAYAGRVFESSEYLDAAAGAADFILKTLYVEQDSRQVLLHRYRNGTAGLPAHLDDYAFMTWGLIELVLAGRTAYLDAAAALARTQCELFWDPEAPGFFYTSSAMGETLIARPKSIYDAAIPSGNTVSYHNLSRLARLTEHTDFGKKAAAMAAHLTRVASGYPIGCSFFLYALETEQSEKTD